MSVRAWASTARAMCEGWRLRRVMQSMAARAGAALGEDALGVDEAEDAESVLGFGVDDGVPAGDDPAGLGDLVGAPAQDLRDRLVGHVLREAGDVEGQRDLRPRLAGSTGAGGQLGEAHRLRGHKPSFPAGVWRRATTV